MTIRSAALTGAGSAPNWSLRTSFAPVIGGLFAALVLLASGAAQLVLRHFRGRRPTTLGLCAGVIGMGIVAASSRVPASLATAIVGGVIAGGGAGVTQMNAMAAVQHRAPPHVRGSVMSTYVTLCYVAISVPVIVAGEAADHFGLERVTAWYAIALALVVTVALVLARRPEEVTQWP